MCLFDRKSKRNKFVLIPPLDYFLNPTGYSVIRQSNYKNNVPFINNFFAIYEKYGKTYTYDEIIGNY